MFVSRQKVSKWAGVRSFFVKSRLDSQSFGPSVEFRSPGRLISAFRGPAKFDNGLVVIFCFEVSIFNINP